jgi:hypothetical protein
MISNSNSSSSDDSALTGSGYIRDYDSDMLIEADSYIGDDDIYPLAWGKISDEPTSPSGMHCMMASHEDGSKSRVNNGRDRQTATGRFITQALIGHTRRVYMGELPLGPNPGEDEVAALQFIINEKKDQINSEKQILERRREEADASSRRCASLSSHYSSSVQRRSQSHLPPRATGTTSRETLRHNSMRSTYCPKPEKRQSWTPPRTSPPMHLMMMSTCDSFTPWHSVGTPGF